MGNLIVRGEDTTFGLETDPGREISRDAVAAVCVQALFDTGGEQYLPGPLPATSSTCILNP